MNIKKVILALIVAVILFPIAINLLMFIPISITSSSLDSKDWLSFWGSYGGGIIGGIGALLALYFTIKYYREKDEEQRKMFKISSNLERISFIQQQIENREIIREENLYASLLDDNTLEKIRKYNELASRLHGFFSEQAVGTLIGVFQIENEKGEIYFSHSTRTYFSLPKEIRELAEIIANLSLYKNCTDLLCGDSRLAYIISVEGGGSAGMWPYWWHTTYLKDRQDIKEQLNDLFNIVEEIVNNVRLSRQKMLNSVYDNSTL